jgi:anti-anti-sigma factor
MRHHELMSTSQSSDSYGSARLRVQATRHDTATVLAVSGEVDMATVDRLEEEIDTTLRNHRPSRLVVDLTAVPFMGSDGWAALVAAREQAGERTQLRLVITPGGRLERPLHVLGLDQTFTVDGSRDAALAAD